MQAPIWCATKQLKNRCIARAPASTHARFESTLPTAQPRSFGVRADLPPPIASSWMQSHVASSFTWLPTVIIYKLRNPMALSTNTRVYTARACPEPWLWYLTAVSARSGHTTSRLSTYWVLGPTCAPPRATRTLHCHIPPPTTRYTRARPVFRRPAPLAGRVPNGRRNVSATTWQA